MSPAEVGSETAVVLNPAAGSGRAERVWTKLLRARPALADATLINAPDPAAAEAALDRALAGGARRVLAIGGDGTLHLVVNRVLAATGGEPAAVGLIPAGTGSDFARGLGLPRRPLAALERALTATPRPLDVLVLERADGSRRHALNVASAGISGAVDLLVNAMPRRGSTAFLTATLRALRDYQPVRCRIAVDGVTWYQGPIFLLAVANGTSFGKGMKVAPRARPDDGLADIVVIEAMPRWQLPLRLAPIYLGAHLRLPGVRWTRGRRVTLEPLAPLPPIDLDGEVVESGPVEIAIRPGALRFCY